MKTAKSATVLFFWDYDTQWGADRSRVKGRSKDWGHLEFSHTERLLELHEQYDVPACFAIVGAAASPGEHPYHDSAQIRRIHAAGHEIGSHAYRHEWLPGLDREALLETLRCSRDALEQCIGSEVVTFVPPFNQPFDYPSGWSFSLAERREAKGERTDLLDLCQALGETGYRICRVAYCPLPSRFAKLIFRGRTPSVSHIEQIGRVACVRLKTSAGFDSVNLAMLDRCVEQGGIAVVYGHPHSLRAGNSQDESCLVPFLKKVRRLRHEGLVQVRLPRDLMQES
jgi:Polysaccharide deacetylase